MKVELTILIKSLGNWCSAFSFNKEAMPFMIRALALKVAMFLSAKN